jgi:26S proteasome regulatory subunit N8
MCELTKKINAKERPVGWYHSGPKLRASDLTIHELMGKYCQTPVLCVIDPHATGVPVQAYVAVEEERGRTFAHVPSGLEAEEAEEVGVEHLLRDLKTGAVGSLTHSIAAKTKSLSALDKHLGELDDYLEAVAKGRLPVQQNVIGAAQDMFNLLPDVQSGTARVALTVKTNDQLAMVYVGALARAVIALNDLVNNKIEANQ